MHGQTAHGAATAADQQGFASHIPTAEHAVGGGHRRNAQHRAFGKADVVWQGHGLILRQGDVFGGGAIGALPLAVPDPDPFTDAGGIHISPHRFDHTGAIAVGNDAGVGRFRHAGAGAGAGVDV